MGRQIQRGLSHLLGTGFLSALNKGDNRSSGAKGGAEGSSQGQWSQGWGGARLVRGELALRSLFFVVERHGDSGCFGQEAWAVVADVLLYARSYGALPTVRIYISFVFMCMSSS